MASHGREENKVADKWNLASSFYITVFNWSFASSTLGIPPDKLLTFTVPSGAFPIGGAICCVEGEESALVKGAKLYLYVEDIVVVMEVGRRHTLPFLLLMSLVAEYLVGWLHPNTDN
jgi:predicted enzyme related to lactoylglutathione lyase